MAVSNEQALAALVRKYPALGYVFQTAFAAAKAHKAKTGETITWDDLPAPAKEITPVKRNQLTGEIETPVDSKGNEIIPARRVFNQLLGKFRPGANNKSANPAIFSQLRTFKAKVNAASGISRGRTSAEPVTAEEQEACASFDVANDV